MNALDRFKIWLLTVDREERPRIRWGGFNADELRTIQDALQRNRAVPSAQRLFIELDVELIRRYGR